MKSLALVRCVDTTELDFDGYYFKILGWKSGYLKIEDDSCLLRLPMCKEGDSIQKFESLYDLLKYVRIKDPR